MAIDDLLSRLLFTNLFLRINTIYYRQWVCARNLRFAADLNDWLGLAKSKSNDSASDDICIKLKLFIWIKGKSCRQWRCRLGQLSFKRLGEKYGTTFEKRLVALKLRMPDLSEEEICEFHFRTLSI